VAKGGEGSQAGVCNLPENKMANVPLFHLKLEKLMCILITFIKSEQQLA
jgi:hypothetical protein